MTLEEEDQVLSLNWSNATRDLASWLEDEILERPLLPEEKESLETKMHYWWLVAEHHERLLIERQMKEMTLRDDSGGLQSLGEAWPKSV